jgi:hypothetical protein
MAEVTTTLKMVRRFVLQKKRANSRKKIGGDILLRIQYLDLRANYEVFIPSFYLLLFFRYISFPFTASFSFLSHEKDCIIEKAYKSQVNADIVFELIRESYSFILCYVSHSI